MYFIILTSVRPIIGSGGAIANSFHGDAEPDGSIDIAASAKLRCCDAVIVDVLELKDMRRAGEAMVVLRSRTKFAEVDDNDDLATL